jgi:hypothetical protein
MERIFGNLVFLENSVHRLARLKLERAARLKVWGVADQARHERIWQRLRRNWLRRSIILRRSRLGQRNIRAW